MRAASILKADEHKMAVESPVFIWEGNCSVLSDDEKRWMIESQLVGRHSRMPTHGPFQCFRVAHQRGFVQCYSQPGVWYLYDYGTAGHGNKAEFVLCSIVPVNNEVPIFSELFVNWKRADAGLASESLQHAVEKSANQSRGYIFHFIARVMLPGSVVVRVGPMPPGEPKPVAWHLARTHYLVLNSRQASLCRKAGRGPSELQISRAAHWRRAHFRRLNSPMFKSKRGVLIPVRHAWVGPKEWRGRDGKVYHLVEIKDDQNGKHNNKT